MKIRAGFVSNSSSSSFVLVGRDMGTVHEITPAMLKKHDYILHSCKIPGNEGSVLIDITDADMLKILQLLNDDGTVYEVYAMGDTGMSFKSVKVPNGKKAVIESFERDYCCPQDKTELMEQISYSMGETSDEFKEFVAEVKEETGFEYEIA